MSNNELSKNKDDTYLLGKHKIQIYRWDKNTLCIMFQSNQTVNNIIPQLEELDIKLELYVSGETESVYKFRESDIHKVHEIVRFQTKGKNISPKSVKNKRRLQNNNVIS
jgi:hypothetical protein